MQNTSRKSCGHCRNLQLEGWQNHHVRACPELAKTICRNCNTPGHTSSYCPDARKQQSDPVQSDPVQSDPVPVTNGWAQIAKKAMTPEDNAASQALEAKIKADAVEKKRKEHEAYLERKANREQKAKEKKDREDAAYNLYKQHMWYLYGNNWYHNFQSGSSRENEIPHIFYDRVQAEIEEDYCFHSEMEAQAEKEQRDRDSNQAAEKAKMKATLSPAELHEEIDDWLDRGFCDHTEAGWISAQREANGKIWLEEKMNEGKIVLGKDGKYKYYA